MALLTVDPGNVDLKKTSGKLFTWGIIGAIGFVAYTWLLPFLLTVVWGTLQLMVGIGAIIFLLWSGPKLLRTIKYLGLFFGQFILGTVIEMNPFNILEYKLEKSESDAEELQVYNKKSAGKVAELEEKISNADSELKRSLEAKRICEKRLRDNPTDQIAADSLEEAIADINSNKEYIDGMQPILNDFKKLYNFTDRAYRTATLGIKIARKDLQKKRDLYETVTTASSTISKAWKALVGDKNLNNDADKAIEALKKDIGSKIGNIRTGLKVTSQFMDGKDLENASKLNATVKQLEGINLDVVSYSSTVDQASSMEVKNLTTSNKYMTYLSDKK